MRSRRGAGPPARPRELTSAVAPPGERHEGSEGGGRGAEVKRGSSSSRAARARRRWEAAEEMRASSREATHVAQLKPRSPRPREPWRREPHARPPQPRVRPRGVVLLRLNHRAPRRPRHCQRAVAPAASHALELAALVGALEPPEPCAAETAVQDAPQYVPLPRVRLERLEPLVERTALVAHEHAPGSGRGRWEGGMRDADGQVGARALAEIGGDRRELGAHLATRVRRAVASSSSSHAAQPRATSR